MSPALRSVRATRVSSWPPILVAMLFAFAVSSCRSGCGGTSQTQDQAGADSVAKTDVVVGPAVDLVALKRVHTRLDASVSSMKILAHEADKYPERMAEHARRFRKRGILNKIPTTPKNGALQKSVTAHAVQHQLKIMKWKISVDPGKPHTPPPKRYEGDDPYPFTQDELVESRTLTIELAPSDKTKVRTFLKTLNEKSPRLVHPHKVVWNDQGALINAHIFRFRTFKAPNRKFLAPTAARLYDEAGFPASGPICGADTRCSALKGKIRGLHEQATQHHAAAERSLALEAEANAWIAREEAFDALTKTVESTNYEALLP